MHIPSWLIATAATSLILSAARAASPNLLDDDTSFETGQTAWLSAKVDDLSGGADGKNALHISRGQDARSPDYRHIIKPGTDYTLSLFVRGNAAQQKVTIQANDLIYGRYAMSSVTINAGEPWRRITLPIPQQKTDRGGLFITVSSSQGDVWIDALSLQEGAAGTYAPALPICLQVGTTGLPGNMVYEQEAPVKLPAGLYNATDTTQHLELVWKARNFTSATVAEGREVVELGAGQTHTYNVMPLPNKQLGFFAVDLSVHDGTGKLIAQKEASFGVVRPPQVSGADAESFFGICNEGVARDAEERIGVKWIRSIVGWSVWEKTRGQVNAPEDYFSSYGRDRMHLMQTVAIVDPPPAWAKQSATQLADPLDFPRMIGQLVKQAQGATQYWEIENEPYWVFPRFTKLPTLQAADAYADIAEPAAAAIRAADPNAKVMMDIGALKSAASEFNSRAFQRLVRLVDVVPIHPYADAHYFGPGNSVTGPEASQLRQTILRVQKMIADAGGHAKVWIGEIGWAQEMSQPVLNPYSCQHANTIARALIIAKSVPGVERFMYFKARGCLERGNYEYGLWRTFNQPFPAAVAYATVAQELDHATPRDVILDSDVQAYTFESERGPVAVIWKWRGDATEMLLDSAADITSAIDLMGQTVQLENKEGKVKIPITESPLFVRGKVGSYNAFTSKLKSANLNMDPVSVATTFSDISQIRFELKNNQAQTAPIAASLVGPASVTVTPKHWTQVLKPGQTDSADFYLKNLDSAISSGQQLQLRVEAGRQTMTRTIPLEFENCLKRTIPWTADNDLKSWAGLKHFVLDKRDQILPPDPNLGWRGPSDLSATISTAWNDQYLYILADVRDDIFVQNQTGTEIWRDDSLQFAFDTLNDAQENQPVYDNNDHEFTAALTSQRPVVARLMGPPKMTRGVLTTVKSNMQRVPGGVVYQLAIPWNELAPLTPSKGRIFGFDLIANDNDGGGRRFWIGLTPGIGEGKNPFAFKKFILR